VEYTFPDENIGRPIEQNRRKDALSDWLESCVKSRVESDLRLIPHGIENAAKRLFALMTGNQIERACEEALDAKYLHLATLLAQTPDEGFREDIIAQLEIWKDEKVEEVLEPDVLKIYQILGGHLVKEGVNGHELDWRRLFGLRLWYGKTACDVDGLQGTLDEFEELLSQGKISAPIPWWLEGSGRDPSSSSQYQGLIDAHFVIMRLAAQQKEPLDSLLRSLSFSPAPLDTKLPFFLSLILVRSLKTRDFSDREHVRGPLPNVYGPSHMAGSLIASYAAMLENVGCVKEAAFVLLFMEAGAGSEFHALGVNRY
jgi:nuclear pore complex protein Nup98-Nup96